MKALIFVLLFSVSVFSQTNYALFQPVTASASIAGFPADYAVDGNPDTWWSSGAMPTQMISINLQAYVDIQRITLLPAQSPAGPTIHRIWARHETGPAFLLAEIESYTEDNVKIIYDLPVEEPGIVFIAIETLNSPSWVAWREIQVFGKKQRQIDVSFLFHANQNLVPQAKVGSQVSFVNLLNVLRNHKGSKFQIHFSGPLLQSLNWLDDRCISIIRDGLADDQFELFGSVFAQNVMYSTRMSSTDFQFNQKQIEFHRELLQHLFGITPVSFWNAERTWTQNFTELIARNGYANVQVEDHILESSGITGSEYLVRTTEYNGFSINVFDDDKEILDRVDNAINEGGARIDAVLSLLDSLYEEDTADQYLVGYYQDAEWVGLQDLYDGFDPAPNFVHLDQLLSRLENDPRVKITDYNEWLQNHQPAEHLPLINDGAAFWMGGDAWFSNVNNHPDNQSFRVLCDRIRNRLNAISADMLSTTVDTTSAHNLLKHAWFTLAAHQFEFGGEPYGEWRTAATTEFQLVRTALVAAQAAEYSLHPVTGIFSADINDDGIDEVIIVNPQDMYVFSRYGGRLIYWFDLQNGIELVGNENFNVDYEKIYYNDNYYVPTARGGYQTYPRLRSQPYHPEILDWYFNVRRRALNDHLEIVGAGMYNLAETEYAVRISDTHVDFETNLKGIKLMKRIVPGAQNIKVKYRIKSRSASRINMSLLIENGLSPSLLQIMNNGRPALEYIDNLGSTPIVNNETRAVSNTIDGAFVKLKFIKSMPVEMEGEEDVFGLELNPRYNFRLRPFGRKFISFQLSRNNKVARQFAIAKIDGDQPATPGQYELANNYPNPFNPSTNIEFQIGAPEFVTLKIFNLVGQEVADLVSEPLKAGTYSYAWNASGVASGVYIYKLQAGNFVKSKKMILLR